MNKFLLALTVGCEALIAWASIVVSRQIKDWQLTENAALIARSPDAHNSIEHLVRVDGFLGGVMATIFAIVVLQVLREIFIHKKHVRALGPNLLVAVIPLASFIIFLC